MSAFLKSNHESAKSKSYFSRSVDRLAIERAIEFGPPVNSQSWVHSGACRSLISQGVLFFIVRNQAFLKHVYIVVEDFDCNLRC